MTDMSSLKRERGVLHSLTEPQCLSDIRLADALVYFLVHDQSCFGTIACSLVTKTMNVFYNV